MRKRPSSPQPSPPEEEYLFSVFDRTLSGFRFNGPPTQGSSFLATLGWRTQSLWDWEGAKRIQRRRGNSRSGEVRRFLCHDSGVRFGNTPAGMPALPGIRTLSADLRYHRILPERDHFAEPDRRAGALHPYKPRRPAWFRSLGCF